MEYKSDAYLNSIGRQLVRLLLGQLSPMRICETRSHFVPTTPAV